MLRRPGGYAEYAEKYLAAIASSKGCAVYHDLHCLYNYETYLVEEDHTWLNNGYSAYIYVP
jgi:hypothetical protein